jgi:hypothetical protein
MPTRYCAIVTYSTYNAASRMSNMNDTAMANTIVPDQTRNHLLSFGSRKGRFARSTTSAGVQQTRCMMAMAPPRNGRLNSAKRGCPRDVDAINPPAAHLAIGRFKANAKLTMNVVTRKTSHACTHNGVAAKPLPSNTWRAPCPWLKVSASQAFMPHPSGLRLPRSFARPISWGACATLGEVFNQTTVVLEVRLSGVTVHRSRFAHGYPSSVQTSMNGTTHGGSSSIDEPQVDVLIHALRSREHPAHAVRTEEVLGRAAKASQNWSALCDGETFAWKCQ